MYRFESPSILKSRMREFLTIFRNRFRRQKFEWIGKKIQLQKQHKENKWRNVKVTFFALQLKNGKGMMGLINHQDLVTMQPTLKLKNR